VQRWNMQKQIDATRYIVPYKTDDRMSIIVLRYVRRRMRIVSQGRLTLWHHSALRCDVTPRCAVTSLRVTLSRDFSPERHPAIRHIHVKIHQHLLLLPFVLHLFCFSAPCHYTSLFNLDPVIFGGTLFGWFISLYLNTFFLWEYHFLFMPLWFMPTFSGTKLGHRTRRYCIRVP